MIRRTALPSLAVVGALLVAAPACGNDDASTATEPEATMTTSEPNSTPPSTPDPTEPTFTTGPEPSLDPPPTSDSAPPSPPPDARPPHGAAVGVAIVDLARRLDVDPSTVTVTVNDEVTWRDGSLGCPQPGMMYTQALVPGRRVVLTVDGVEYSYHGGSRGELFYCAKPAADGTAPDGIGRRD